MDAEATSCRAAIRTAKGVVDDIGKEGAKKSPGLFQLAGCKEDHSERDVHKVVAKDYKLALPIEMTRLPKVPGMMYSGEIKVLALRSWITFIVQYNVWHLLCGLHKANPERETQILLEFWRRYRLLRPSHRIFQLHDRGQIDLSRCAPLMVHGDEGRGRKKAGFLCVSYYSYIGFGTQESNLLRKHRSFLQMRLNYGGATFLHRFLTAVLPKMLKDDYALKAILNFIADDVCDVLANGVRDSQGHVYTTCVLQVVGDWQFLVKAGSLTRSYSNVQKRPLTEASRPKGICHMCQAGQRDVPWENYRSDTFPAWWGTMHVEDAFEGDPALNRIPFIPGERAAFYTYDLFHSYHLGVGKSFVAGCLAMASEYMWAGKADDRLEQLSSLWLTWAGENHVSAYLFSITRSLLGWPDKGTFPNGQWSKGHVTSNLGRFFESWASEQNLEGDELMTLALETSKKITLCLRKLYESDVWLNRGDAEVVVENGLGFLEGYKRLATLAFRNNVALFPHMPKGHSLDHIFWGLKADLGRNNLHYFLNPLNHAVQIAEDWVGRTSRLSRRTGPPQVIVRVLQRVLQACYAHWRKAGYLTW